MAAGPGGDRGLQSHRVRRPQRRRRRADGLRRAPPLVGREPGGILACTLGSLRGPGRRFPGHRPRRRRDACGEVVPGHLPELRRARPRRVARSTSRAAASFRAVPSFGIVCPSSRKEIWVRGMSALEASSSWLMWAWGRRSRRFSPRRLLSPSPASGFGDQGASVRSVIARSPVPRSPRGSGGSTSLPP